MPVWACTSNPVANPECRQPEMKLFLSRDCRRVRLSSANATSRGGVIHAAEKERKSRWPWRTAGYRRRYVVSAVRRALATAVHRLVQIVESSAELLVEEFVIRTLDQMELKTPVMSPEE